MRERTSSTRALTMAMFVALCLAFVGLAAGSGRADESGQAQARSLAQTQPSTQEPEEGPPVELIMQKLQEGMEEGAPEEVRDRVGEQVEQHVREAAGNALRERIRLRIEDETGLEDQERERLRKHLGECDRVGLDDAAVAALFSEKAQLKSQIRTQERVLTMAREGLPVDLVMQKLQEGLRKGAPQELRERVCAQVEEHVRAAYEHMKQAREAGVTPGEENAERQRVREMASYMWRGLKESDMEQLRKRAQLRLRDGSCTSEELTTAAETATRLMEIGVKRERAVRLAGDALQNGYTVREMKQLSWAVMTARTHGGSSDAVMGMLERGIRNQNQFSQMMKEMQEQGWMGPAERQGGHSPVDNAGGSGYGGRPSGGMGGVEAGSGTETGGAVGGGDVGAGGATGGAEAGGDQSGAGQGTGGTVQ
ncbi:MAG: hypothetical protein JW952_02020 [Candidatus Eisenbacteria bacterium]|nr:hypothetical protein [Candidatus Eisenbacteria bacterium]